MTKRAEHAYIAQSGASNPRRLATCLVEAIDECRAENIEPAQDAAVFMILHQLGWLLMGQDIGSGDRWLKASKEIGL